MSRVVTFTVAYTVALFGYGTYLDSPLTNIYTGINIGLFVLFGVLHAWARFPIHALWAVSLVGLGNMLGGVLVVDARALYMAEILGPVRYDKFFHTLAATAMVIVAWEAMKRWSDGVRHLGGQLLLTWLVVMGGGAVVEIAELIGSTLTGTDVGDYANNALDLVANGLGGAIGVGLVRWFDSEGASPLAHRHSMPR